MHSSNSSRRSRTLSDNHLATLKTRSFRNHIPRLLGRLKLSSVERFTGLKKSASFSPSMPVLGHSSPLMKSGTSNQSIFSTRSTRKSIRKALSKGLSLTSAFLASRKGSDNRGRETPTIKAGTHTTPARLPRKPPLRLEPMDASTPPIPFTRAILYVSETASRMHLPLQPLIHQRPPRRLI